MNQMAIKDRRAVQDISAIQPSSDGCGVAKIVDETGVPITSHREPASDLLALIERVATNPNLPMERFERLLAMKQEIDDRARDLAKQEQAERAEREFDAAMAACQAEIPVVLKNKRNSQTGSDYADLAKLYETAMPIITKHGFNVSFSPAGVPADFPGLRLRYRLAHNGGHVEKDVADIPMSTQGAKGNTVMTGTHAFGSAASYGRRYLTLMLFNIATGDDDGNKAGKRGANPVTAEQFQAIQRLMNDLQATPAEEDKLLAYLGIENLHDMNEAHFKRAERALNKKLKEKREGARA